MKMNRAELTQLQEHVQELDNHTSQQYGMIARDIRALRVLATDARNTGDAAQRQASANYDSIKGNKADLVKVDHRLSSLVGDVQSANNNVLQRVCAMEKEMGDTSVPSIVQEHATRLDSMEGRVDKLEERVANDISDDVAELRTLIEGHAGELEKAAETDTKLRRLESVVDAVAYTSNRNALMHKAVGDLEEKVAALSDLLLSHQRAPDKPDKPFEGAMSMFNTLNVTVRDILNTNKTLTKTVQKIAEENARLREKLNMFDPENMDRVMRAVHDGVKRMRVAEPDLGVVTPTPPNFDRLFRVPTREMPPVPPPKKEDEGFEMMGDATARAKRLQEIREEMANGKPAPDNVPSDCI